jgi:hypothetical protein
MIEQKNTQRKVYWNGVYYNAASKDVEVLKQQAPHLYAKLFPLIITNTLDNRKIQVYQVYYDEQTKEGLKYGFIPYFQESAPHNFENDIMLSIWSKRNWINAKYVGVLSWRLYEKTLLKKIKLSGDVVILNCKNYEKFEHPFSRKCFGSVNQMVKLADEHKLFPFILDKIETNYTCWCNYWICTPEVFDDYCTNYLSKAVEFFKTTELYDAKEKHRDKMYYSMTFFLEGLFSVFLTKRNYKVKII